MGTLPTLSVLLKIISKQKRVEEDNKGKLFFACWGWWCVCVEGGLGHLVEKRDGDWKKEVERESKQMELRSQSRMFQKQLENWTD